MMPKKFNPLPPNPTLHQYLAHHIARSGLTHREIAIACGFKRSNMVSMIKVDETRLPLERLGAMARALDVDSFVLFDLWMREHYASTWLELRPLIQRAPPAIQ